MEETLAATTYRKGGGASKKAVAKGQKEAGLTKIVGEDEDDDYRDDGSDSENEDEGGEIAVKDKPVNVARPGVEGLGAAALAAKNGGKIGTGAKAGAAAKRQSAGTGTGSGKTKK